MATNKLSKKLTVTRAELKHLFTPTLHYERINKLFLFLIGVVFTPITLIGMLAGYRHAYTRFMEPNGEMPELRNLRPIVRVSMLIGAALIWILLFIAVWLLVRLFYALNIPFGVVLTYIGVNIAICGTIYVAFMRWRNLRSSEQLSLVREAGKFGSATWAGREELAAYADVHGLYLGGDYRFADRGHLLTVAGTRGGKGTNIVIPNLLNAGFYNCSWVVIDPKGENAAVTGEYRRAFSDDAVVVVLNPWDLLHEHVGESQTYNPLDILSDITSSHVVDDAQIIAEMLVPIDKGDKDKFFTDNARSIMAGILLHLVTSQDKETRTLSTLWQWVRLPKDEWEDLICEMSVSQDPVSGQIIRNCANEILQFVAAGEKTFGNIMATILQCTDFLKSPALRQSLQTGFDPKTLSNGLTTVYVIIPADKLQSHARWLRLVVTTLMRAVVRQPKERVCFMLDEFAALGYLPEIETALSTYAGYNITVWPILQSLIQLKALYKDNWETVVGNAAVRMYFSINDNFTADYVSKAAGQATHTIIDRNIMGRITGVATSARLLATPDELHRWSGEHIFTFIGDKPLTWYRKLPYYKHPVWKIKAGPNPYILEEKAGSEQANNS